jgi:hypothetical protein
MFTKFDEMTSKVDIYALGMIVYFLQSGGSFPHNCNETLSTFRRSLTDDLSSLVSEGEDKDFFPDELQDFLS